MSFDGRALGEQLLAGMKSYVSRQVDPLTKRIGELETQNVELRRELDQLSQVSKSFKLRAVPR